MMKFDGIVVGGGPAGIFAAIMAVRQGQNVLLLERNDRLGKKLLITGKGRCNVTNDCDPREVLQNIPRNSRFLYGAVAAFPPERVKAFFEDANCPLKTERGNRVFPVSDRSQSVLDALQQAIAEEGREAVARRLEEHAEEINRIVQDVLFDESGKPYRDETQPGINRRIQKVKSLLLGRPLTVQESWALTEEGEETYVE